MNARLVAAAALAMGIWSGSTGAGFAQEKIKIGMIADFTGPFAAVGTMLRQGMDTYMAMHGNKIGGREIEVIYRDANPATAKQVAEELAVRDKVSIFGGFALTPEAAAVASISQQAKIPTVLMVPSSPTLMKMSPYFVRSCNNMPATVMPGAEWAIKQGKRKAYIAVSDYAPGYEVQAAFKKRFEELGGKVVAEDRLPLNTVDYAPFAERIARSEADVVQVFIPPGTPSISFTRGLVAQGVMKKGTTVIGIGETDEYFLPLYDDSVLGYYSSFNYSALLTNPENVAFRAQLDKQFEGKAQPDPFVVHGFDGMHLMYKMIESQAGKTFDGAAAVEAIKGYSWKSPRGPMSIDPETRDVVQNMYIRQVQRVDGKLANVIIDTFNMVKPVPAN
jgi:branched-chain amino acid transport system substrate-binding protein